MKKSILLICFAIMSCASINAQKEKTARLMPRHTLIMEGWRLVDTNIEDGITCEQYVKEINDEDITVYTYRKGDGSFITLKEKKDGHHILFSYSSPDFEKCVLGDFLWKISEDNDYLYARQRDTYQVILPNGVLLEKGNSDILMYPENADVLIMPDNPKKKYERVFLTKNAWDDVSGFLIGDRLYKLDANGDISPFMQKHKLKSEYTAMTEMFFYASRLDTIVDIKNEEMNVWEILYKNGDRFKYVNSGNGKYTVGTLHRPGGVLQIKKSVLTRVKDNGYESERLCSPVLFVGDDGCITEYTPKSFSYDEVARFYGREDIPKLQDGQITYPDGAVIKYIEGMTETEWNAKKDAEMAAIKKKEEKERAEWNAKKEIERAEKAKEEAKEKAEYEKERNYYINKYGFYPGEKGASWADIIKPGRPINALKEYFHSYQIRLVTDRGSIKQYKYTKDYGVTGPNGAWIWTKNGIITSVKWY